jgi:asparagine synthase (glutamine-hydrolysing)
MGGFAVSVRWSAPIDRSGFDRMCDLMKHRSHAGMRQLHLANVSLAEGRLARDGAGAWDIASDGDLAVVGDIRLWGRGSLATAAGIADASRVDDRALLLHAYRTLGASMMEHVDGDFAFVIWDGSQHSLFAARDRFGAKPLWMQRTDDGVVLASEPKQIVANSRRPPEASEHEAVQHLTSRFSVDAQGPYVGVERLLPAHTLMAGRTAVHTSVYWQLAPRGGSGLAPPDVPTTFRKQLTDAVARRIHGSRHTISQMSGGLDSPSVAASAHILTAETLDPTTFLTASAVFGDLGVDESRWIAQIAAGQPFDHVDFEPRVGTIEDFTTDMGWVDAPTAWMRHDLLVTPGTIGTERDSDLLLTGNGGDDVVSDIWVLADILRSDGFDAWRRALRATSGAYPMQRPLDVVHSLRLAAPKRLKALARRIPRRHSRPAPLSVEAGALLRSIREPTTPISSGVDALTHLLTTGQSLRMLEFQESMMSRFGMEVSHPFLDRTLVEFVADIAPSARPLTPLSKSLIRTAMVGHLPDGVLERRDTTFATSMIVADFAVHLPTFTLRFPTVPEQALGLVDPSSYTDLCQRAHRGTLTFSGIQRLWNTWAYLLWIETVLPSMTLR